MGYRVADAIVDSLVAHGADRGFSVPGESFLALLDALHERRDFDLVTCRHEGSAALAAIADAKLTGRPGVVMASRGPGAFNAAIGVHVASEEAIPLILLIGQVERANLGRGAVQEIDSSKAFSGLLKWSARIDRAESVAEIMGRAFAIAASGTPGSVAVELPEDVLTTWADKRPPRIHGLAVPAASVEEAGRVHELLANASRPILVVGGECRTPEFRRDLQELVGLWDVPVALTNKNQDQFSNLDPHWIGQLGFFASPAHVALFSEADLLIAVGSRLGDVSSLGFAFPRQDPNPQRLVHVYPDAGMIGRHFQTELPIVSSSHAFVRAALRHGKPAATSATWMARVAETANRAHGWQLGNVAADDVMGHAVMALSRLAARDAILTTDSGNFASWVHRIFKMTPEHRLLGSACGAMGTGVPSGVAAGLRHPGREVLAFVGDGGFLMNGNELITAVDRRLNLRVVVSNNGSYGTIRTHQQRHFPDRVSGTDLANPDFCRLADAFGARGFRIEHAEDASSVVEQAMSVRGPAVIEVCCHPDVSVDRSVK
ncbi:thiamine pyrophosphate-dependent enzyme [Variovorax guangxiensis]|uniref:thiamine pyrophosphate-dependent enzyme n=1 Tax=Variovorax guangxiensis TaxID=1775474 RepID=UPI00285C8502|nr:thiamine pyrophosphate-dependent enzyme [Variovorax guangxiensis]MDR6861083.1 acetolactate synthase-1/2/3 large subunit [Variovorax guangxiensis]